MSKIVQNWWFFIRYPLVENVKNRSKSMVFHRVTPYWKCKNRSKCRYFTEYPITENVQKTNSDGSRNPVIAGGGSSLTLTVMKDSCATQILVCKNWECAVRMGSAGALDGLGNQEYPTTILSQNTQHACEANTAQGNVDCDCTDSFDNGWSRCEVGNQNIF